MFLIVAENVHQALPIALDGLIHHGVERQSRNGPVLMFPMPTTTYYKNPTQRVIFWPERDANPYFHFFESLWMLAGRNDVESISYFNKNIVNYSDNGEDFWGAYGHRWRKWFEIDQLELIVKALKKNPDCRRQVLGMWDPAEDLSHTGKDLPCNLTITFQINHQNRLDMTVFNRSNDLIWGAYGANAVHFSMLQEYVASSVGVLVGGYWQVSHNSHVYAEMWHKVKSIADSAPDPHRITTTDVYQNLNLDPFPLFFATNKEDFDEDLYMFVQEGANAIGYRSKFFRHVALPMLNSWRAFKELEPPQKYTEASLIIHQGCKAKDWSTACREWIQRRWIDYKEKQ